LRYKLTEMENRKVHLPIPALQPHHIRIVRPYFEEDSKPDKGTTIHDVPEGVTSREG
jgi:hypothetical protein